MNKPRDESSQESPTPGSANPGSTDSPQPADSKRSGRIAYDERGNSIWEWQLETGVYSRDISTQRLKKLDLDDLSIAETASHPRPPGLTDPSDRKAMPGGGSNPYDNSTTGGGNIADDPYNSADRGALKSEQRRARNDSKNPSPRKPADLKKLDEWIALRKRVEQDKREGDED